MNYQYPAFFDVDKTLLGINSGSLMVKASTREGLTGYHHFMEALFITTLHKMRLLSAEKTMGRLAAWFRGREEAEIIDFSSRLFHNRLKHHIRPGALNELVYHRNNNAELIILSASTPYTCFPLMQELNIPTCLCTELEVTKGIFSGKPSTPYCYGDEKYVRAAEYCSKKGYSLKDAFYYGDSWSDIPILEAVGNPICVNPDKKLRRTAVKKGWAIHQW